MEKIELTRFEIPIHFFLGENQKDVARKMINAYYKENNLSDEELQDAHWRLNPNRIGTINVGFYNDGSFSVITNEITTPIKLEGTTKWICDKCSGPLEDDCHYFSYCPFCGSYVKWPEGTREILC